MMLMKLTTSLPCLAIFLKLSCKLNFFKYAFWKNFWKEDPSSANNSKSFFLNVTLLSHFRPHKYTSDYNSITISKSKENRNWNSLISGTMMSHKIFHHIILSFIYIKLDFERTLKLGYNHGYNEQIWTVLWCYIEFDCTILERFVYRTRLWKTLCLGRIKVEPISNLNKN